MLKDKQIRFGDQRTVSKVTVTETDFYGDALTLRVFMWQHEILLNLLLMKRKRRKFWIFIINVLYTNNFGG